MPDQCVADLVIFDLDGTLVDTRRDLANAVNHALQQLGKKELEIEIITRYVGDGVRKLLERVLQNGRDEELEVASRYFRYYYLEHLTDFSLPYPGIRETLEHFDHKKKAVLTNKPQEFTEAILQRLALRHYFDVVAGGQPGLKLKPHPEAVMAVLQCFEVPLSAAVMIGDGENDILVGKAAGVKTCAVTYGFRSEQELLALQPDFFVQDAIALKRLIV
jgi:phosphoglycolate phosphatase